MEFAGKTAFITGGARGLGGETARWIAAAGGDVVITDILEREGEALAKEIGATFIYQDVSDEDQWVSLAGEVFTRFGRVDVLMNNAAILHTSSIADYRTSDWQRVMSINQTSVFFSLREFGARMVEQGFGSIINVGSIAVKQHIAGSMAYTASKCALVGMTKVAAREFGPAGVRVNAILPGMMDTQMVEDIDPGGHRREELAKGVPLRRTAGPDEVAKVALFLASDQSSFCTGEALQVDGGASC